MERLAETLAAHHSWLRRVARRIAKSSAAADDLVQDTCVTALQNAPADAEMRPWLRSVMFKLAWGRTRSEIRRTRREKMFYQHTPPRAEPDPLLRYGVDRRRLAEALESLPEPFRSTLVQRFIEGRSCVEIARDQQVPATTVRTWQMRALELLRTRLEGQPRRGRRARMLWLLPALGIERAAAAVSRGLLALSGQGKLVVLVLVGLAVALGFHLLDTRRQEPATSTAAAQSAVAGRQSSGGFDRSWPDMLRAERARTERLLAAALARSPDGEPSYLTSLLSAGSAGGDPARRRSRRRAIDDDSHPATRLFEDCHIDEHGELRCSKPRTPNIPGRPTCDFLNRNIAFFDTTRSTQLMKVPFSNRFLTAALLTNMALASNMGCQPSSDNPGGIGAVREHDPAQDPSLDDDPTCVTREGQNGGECTICTDATGARTITCTPGDCFDEILPDGWVCTTCADQYGVHTDCEMPDPEDPERNCTSWIPAPRIVSTWCDGDETASSHAADCSLDAAGCQTCVGANGVMVTECPAEDYCFGNGGDPRHPVFATCSTCLFVDGTAVEQCHYPGPDSCETFTDGDARCIDCSYPNGDRSGICLTDPDAPLPDPLSDLPADLPAPGTCVSETSPGGYWSCNTCTGVDGQATWSCNYGAEATCALEYRQDGQTCLNCTYPDGSAADLCLTLF